jgi:formylglycine-generating enzyme required for sulfatase activity
MGEVRWDEARRLFGAARTILRDATSRLEAMLLTGNGVPRVSQAMAEVIYRHIVIARDVRDDEAIDELMKRLATHDDGTYRERLSAAMPVTITATGATGLEVHQYLADPEGRMTLSPHGTAVEGSGIKMTLLPGSYLAKVHAPGIDPVMSPFVVAPDAPSQLSVALPRPGQVPPGMIYVPPGSFLLGSTDRTSFRTIYQHAPPLHRRTTGAYLIARTEVTFAEYLAFLRDPAGGRARREDAPEDAASSVRLELDARGRARLTLQPTSEVYSREEGVAIVYPDRTKHSEVAWEQLPVSGISFDDAKAYADWLARTGKLPRARLCSDLEWERAARGADTRRFPHGDVLEPDDANFDRTYGKVDGAFGPDQVGTYPASTSPFGVADMAGNIFEWVMAFPRPHVRGGSWYQGPTTADISNRSDMNRTAVHVWLGIRICADL